MLLPAETLARALRASPSREAQVLLRGCAGTTALATWYGISAPAAEALWEEAAQALAASLGQAGAPEPGPEGLRQALVAQEAAVRALLALAEEDAERSPERARETWLRRGAIVAILALTAWFYLHQAPAPH